MATCSSASLFHSTSPFILGKKMQSLQWQHRQLQQSIRERIESLRMQIHLPLILHPTMHSGVTSVLVDSMLEEQAALHRLTSEQLLEKQIRVQEQADFKEIIRCYEKRVMDLRTMLVSKEAEIVYDTFQLRRDTIPKRENLQILNNQALEKQAVRKYMEEMKRLRVEVGALEAVMVNRGRKHYGEDVSFLSVEESPVRQGEIVRQEELMLEKKNSGGKDKKDNILAKLQGLLEEELQREQKLQEQLRLVKKQREQSSSTHRTFCNKYSSLAKQRKKDTEQPKLQFILQALEEQPQKPSQPCQFFKQKDLNTATSSKPKHRQTLRDRRKPTSKQN